LQHAQAETPGLIAEVLRAAGIGMRPVETFRPQPVPAALDDAAGLVVMGGPMGVYEQARYPFLADEMRLIEQALRADKPVLGVCLGSQLLAAVLGSPVNPGRRKEIGWHRVTLTPAAAADPLWVGVPSSFTGYHWHGDAFELPRGATGLAASELTACQAFRHGRSAYGLLFHLEVTESIIAAMVAAFADECVAAGVDGAEISRRMPQHLPPLQAIGRTVFARWAGMVAGATR
jgi:GMP synthase (glutamine-hydrolysing)